MKMSAKPFNPRFLNIRAKHSINPLTLLLSLDVMLLTGNLLTCSQWT